ncbi:hypothetical protein GCM10010145_21480 [Streptomyces ruber]|uniref:Cell envelope biogenesis protein OmpA n=2 Tax=Streptomyces TaxID=1883 RepID=A0A918BB88_9ACTN|nr:hypothetical protein [Streptomyces ruber]GGQ51832.1 hypothetical protein GCM10010145_21480 [Streptomyces ruber]
MSSVVDRPLSPYRSAVPSDAVDAGVFRIIADPRTPVFVSVHASGRRRYGYWQPFDARTNRGGCYVALPTDVCDRLHSAGRILLGDPLEDPGKTTYRVWPARTPAPAVRRPAAAVRIPVRPAPAGTRTLVA